MPKELVSNLCSYNSTIRFGLHSSASDNGIDDSMRQLSQ